ncbi:MULTISPECIES: tricarballylate utilization 4Fe-4S protein TcuB [unclassified Halomonas]|uniref:tricarballylate utilization 4Fe-4S protein TcuB n=1 Tax=unclassified Halomonas TaxID=2609666 RepID=UPI001CF1BC3E|nr:MULTISPECIES: tricarballylate utilization 4Fe-4S protein TcuB [unclassified Halomonas]MCA8862761.1 tricarballylate utilization 4Fe-4S protein TcuB [Halomonas sp. SBBP1]UZH09731.1 tricarballylate utilization 4Fe-4S protein TcuB [Halomonas sp. BDJS001]
MQKIDAIIEETRNNMTICNACRYCEGFCPVFPAMERRRTFTPEDLKYLANLCHNCGECYYACQYAPPHEFAVNVPQSMAKLRVESYRQYAWPQPLARLFDRSGLLAALALAVGLTLILLIAIALNGDLAALVTTQHSGDFYALLPHNTLVVTFGSVSLFALLVLIMGMVRFWRESGEGVSGLGDAESWQQALKETFSLKHLHGQEGAGCTYPDAYHSHWRRRFHHFTFYGFMLCFAATVTGTLYHYLFGWQAPYNFISLPKLFGTLGGIGLLIGPAGLLYLKLVRDKETADVRQMGMDVAFIVLLWLTGLTGLSLMLLRETSAMGVMLVVHLGVVMALFITMPYGKFVHGFYRLLAVYRNALERNRLDQ